MPFQTKNVGPDIVNCSWKNWFTFRENGGDVIMASEVISYSGMWEGLSREEGDAVNSKQVLKEMEM